MRDETTLFLINLVKSKLAGLQMDQITLSESWFLTLDLPTIVPKKLEL